MEKGCLLAATESRYQPRTLRGDVGAPGVQHDRMNPSHSGAEQTTGNAVNRDEPVRSVGDIRHGPAELQERRSLL